MDHLLSFSPRPCSTRASTLATVAVVLSPWGYVDLCLSLPRTARVRFVHALRAGTLKGSSLTTGCASLLCNAPTRGTDPVGIHHRRERSSAICALALAPRIEWRGPAQRSASKHWTATPRQRHAPAADT